MIDKNGKIGGKVNLIDLIIVVVMLAAIVFAVYRFFFANDKEVTSDPVKIEFTCTDANDYTIEQLEIGAPVLDGSSEDELGIATDFEIDKATSYTVTDTGKLVIIDIPFSKSVVVTIEGTGTLDDNGVVIEGTRYGIGHSMVIFVGDCKLWGKISGIDPA